jgi:hypothetical protein
MSFAFAWPSAPGKRDGVQTQPSWWSATQPIAACRAGGKPWLWDAFHAGDSR